MASPRIERPIVRIGSDGVRTVRVLTGPAQVFSVNGREGNVVLDASDIGGVSADDLAAEAQARADADSTLSDAIDAHVGEVATGSPEPHPGYVQDAELTAALSGGTAVDSTARAAIIAEASTRSGADDALSDAIGAEATTRATNDTTLAGGISTEATARANADIALQGLVDEIETDLGELASADTAEASARADADADLQDQLDAHVGAGPAADPEPHPGYATDGELSAEASTRATADTNESTARTSADSGLQLQIDALAGGAAQDDTARAAAAAAQAAADAAQADIDAHEAAGDPHTQYVLESTIGQANGVASLDSSGKVPIAQLPDTVVGALDFQGLWNASTNTPNLGASSPSKGDFWKVSVAGSTSLGGITDWQIGDWAIYDGSAWGKLDQSESVSSVAGRTGAIVLTVSDISDSGAFGRSLVQAALAGDARTLLGLVIGSTVQAYSAVLGYLGGLAPAADRLPYFDGASSAALATFTGFGRTLLALTTVLTEAVGGTGQTTYTLGDLLYASATNTLSKLAGNTTTARKFLRQVGNGSVSAGPAWDTLIAGDIPDVSATAAVIGNFLAALAALATTGFLARTGAGTVASRTITGGTGISVTNGTGIAGDPTIALAAPAAGSVGGITPSKGVSGRYSFDGIAVAGTMTTIVPVVGTVLGSRQTQRTADVYDRIAIEQVTAMNAGKKFMIAIYKVGADGFEDTPIWHSGNQAGDGANGLKEFNPATDGTRVDASYFDASNRFAPPFGSDFYTTLQGDSGTGSFRAVPSANARQFLLGTASFQGSQTRADGSAAFGATPPSPMGTATVANGAVPIIALRAV